ncbi:MAG TPA: hypothetical protein ENN79_09950 [Desulfobacteraceae bacterium]|nr:hypothetical protein [Desulfobacteraceae bacterium]
MQAIKHFLSLFVALSLMVAGIPFVNFQDVNNDGKIDLQDAIVLTRGLVKSAETSGPFAARVADAVTALNRVAEMTPSIELDDSASEFILTNLGVYIPPDRPVIGVSPVEGRVDSFLPLFNSITPVPNLHPPRA